MSYKVTLIPGDGIGPEVIQAALICLEALAVDIQWERKEAGLKKRRDDPSVVGTEEAALAVTKRIKELI